MADRSVVGTRTYGERPRPFRIEDDGELYYIGSEVMKTSFFLIKLQ